MQIFLIVVLIIISLLGLANIVKTLVNYFKNRKNQDLGGNNNDTDKSK